MMKRQVDIKLKSNFIDKYKKGYPLLYRASIVNTDKLEEEGTILNLVDERGDFIARGYYGLQNKGLGWILTRKKDENIDQEFFKKKLIVALNKRTKFFHDPDTTAFRVFNGEGDGIGGLIIECFDGYYVVNWYSKGIYSFRDEILNSLKTLVDYKGIYEKKRFSEEGKYIDQDDFIMGQRAESPIIVKENGVKLAIYLNDGAMVGVFLDQRQVRKAIMDRYSKDKRVLNTFSYTGVFSVFASLGGAKITTSVDLANRSLPKTIEMFNINNIDEKNHEIIVEDVFKYFKYAERREIKFDLVILDPPSFAQAKNFKFSADKDYKELIKDAITLTEDGGVILASTNSSSFNMEKFKDFIRDAFWESKGKYEILEEYSLPGDFKVLDEFKEGNYLKVIFIKKIY